MSTGQKGPQGLRVQGNKYIVTRTVPEPMVVYAKVCGVVRQAVRVCRPRSLTGDENLYLHITGLVVAATAGSLG
jgi:hypothetical protein